MRLCSRGRVPRPINTEPGAFDIPGPQRQTGQVPAVDAYRIIVSSSYSSSRLIFHILMYMSLSSLPCPTTDTSTGANTGRYTARPAFCCLTRKSTSNGEVSRESITRWYDPNWIPGNASHDIVCCVLSYIGSLLRTATSIHACILVVPPTYYRHRHSLFKSLKVFNQVKPLTWWFVVCARESHVLKVYVLGCKYASLCHLPRIVQHQIIMHHLKLLILRHLRNCMKWLYLR